MARSHQAELAVPDASTVERVRGRSVASDLLISLRPGQWTKNLIVFAALIFGRRLMDPAAVAAACVAFLVFCGLGGTAYLINDVLDREQDRRHPLKTRRPIASGALRPSTALAVALVLGGAGVGAAFWITPAFGGVAAAYLVLQMAYSGWLKHVVILDVLTIAIGFVLRAVGGGVAIAVPVSQWLLVCTILLALFLALSKRRHELVLLAEGAAGHRPILGEYSPYLLDQMIGVVTASTLVAYVFYAISPDTAQRFGTPLLGLTIPLPLYGIFRYLYLVHGKEKGGSPAELLVNDRPLLACVALWAIAVILIIYHPFGSWPGPRP
jgi:4-hydroxybenzoate polyprenyltransferase